MIQNKDLKRRIIEISYKHNLSHIGSCLTAVDIIKEIYDTKRKDERFILSSGHAGLALYVILESKGGGNAEDILDHHGIHPDRCRDCSLDVSTGSLGQGLPIAVGMALAHRKKNVYCLISDGECSEGSIHEAIRIAEEQQLHNLHIYVNYNGYGAYKKIPNYPLSNLDNIYIQPQARYTNVDYLPFLKGQDAHYYSMKEEDYNQAMEILK